MMPKIIKHIPNFITSLNLVAGSIAVIFAVDGHLIWAGIFITLAAILDFLDGLAARILNSWSKIGQQLDSLADLISFGLAPAVILFTLLEFSMFRENKPVYEIIASWDQWLILFSVFLMPVMGALRLARYNVTDSGELFFRGLPVPANGLFWAAMGLMLEFPPGQEYIQIIYSTGYLLIAGLFTSGFMIISLPMFSLKIKNFKLNDNWYRYLFILISVILILFFNVCGLSLTILTYIFLNILLYLTGVRY